MMYRNLAIAAVVSAVAACASTGGSTTDGTTTTTTATTDSLGATATTDMQTAATDTMAATTTTTVDSASARSTSDMTAGGDMAGAAQMDSLISVLDRGITTVPQAEAMAAISAFESYLSSATDPALSGMSSEFAALRTQLQTAPVDNKAVGAALTQLGTRATTAAQSAGPNSDRVSRLATALTNAGTKLSGGM